MNISRRNFFLGGVSAGALGAFGGNRFLCSAFTPGRKPNIRFGVVSDIHITRIAKPNETMLSGSNELTFRHTLEWFRDQNVDAVMIAGDMADLGMDKNLMAVSHAWYTVFPDDKYPDGRPIEKVFVTGNHDWQGYNYGNAAKKAYPDETERAKHVLQVNMAGWWRKAFREDYSPIYSKTIKGYTFIGTHWDTGSVYPKTHGRDPFERIRDFMAANGKNIDPKLPFFYVQHPPLKDTCYGPWTWGHDKGVVTETFSAYPNAIGFSGHCHYTLTDERAFWQGAFTAVSTSSLRYTWMPYCEHLPVGYENTTTADWKLDAVKLLPHFRGGDSRQGMLWSVYDDCIVVKRREFLSGLDLGDDWVMPLPAAESKPFAFAERARKFHAPQFPEDAKLEVSSVKAKTRGGSSRGGKETIEPVTKDALKVVAPAVVPDKNARLYKLEFVAETKDGAKKTKLLLPIGYNHALSHANASKPSFCPFAKDELGTGEVRFTVTPINCFGARGKPLVSEWVAI